MLLRIEQAELRGKSFLCRTAASFVSTRIGIIPKAPILPKDLGINKERKGGLIVVGSYVPKTTKQVEKWGTFVFFLFYAHGAVIFYSVNIHVFH